MCEKFFQALRLVIFNLLNFIYRKLERSRFKFSANDHLVNFTIVLAKI